MKKTKEKATKKPAAAAKPVSVSVVLKVYPHVLHVEIDGQERPELRKMHPTADTVAHIEANYAARAGHTVKIERLNSQGGPA